MSVEVTVGKLYEDPFAPNREQVLSKLIEFIKY